MMMQNFTKLAQFCEILGFLAGQFSQKCANFVKNGAMSFVKSKQSIKDRVMDKILEHGQGWCFSPIHFLDLGSDVSIRKALSELHKENKIRRLSQGIYDYPRMHAILGMIPPDLNEVAKVIAEKNDLQIQPAGAYAANLVGLTTQVPGRIIFLTEGYGKQVKVGNQIILFKKSVKKMMAAAGTREGLLIQALKNIGKDHIDQVARTTIKNFLKDSTEASIKANMKFAPAWIRTLVFNIMGFKT